MRYIVSNVMQVLISAWAAYFQLSKTAKIGMLAVKICKCGFIIQLTLKIYFRVRTKTSGCQEGEVEIFGRFFPHFLKDCTFNFAQKKVMLNLNRRHFLQHFKADVNKSSHTKNYINIPFPTEVCFVLKSIKRLSVAKECLQT